MTIRHTIIITAASAALSLLAVTAAFAHAHLVRSTPAEGGAMKTAPSTTKGGRLERSLDLAARPPLRRIDIVAGALVFQALIGEPALRAAPGNRHMPVIVRNRLA